jgi:hypothetical protein
VNVGILWGQPLWKRVFSGIWGVKAKGDWHGLEGAQGFYKVWVSDAPIAAE